MASALSVNPMQTTNARGTFYAKSDGLIQVYRDNKVVY